MSEILLTVALILAIPYMISGLIHNVMMVREIRAAHRQTQALEDHHNALLERAKDLGIIVVQSGGCRRKMDA